MKFHAIAFIILLAFIGCSPKETMEMNEKDIITEFIMEVNNGGFNQYFFNLSGDNAQSTLAVLDKIEAVDSAKILQSAISKFPGSQYPSEREIRQGILKKIDPDEELFGELNLKVWNLEEDPESLYDSYLSKH